MAGRLKASALKWALAFALAAMASLFAATAAFASPNVNVTFPVTTTTNGTTTTVYVTENVDLATVANEDADPVVGMFYKSSVWNVIVTGTDSNQYATVSDILDAAVSAYGNNVKVSDFWNSNTSNVITFAVDDDQNGQSTSYTKYHPSYADVNDCQYFFDLATNTSTSLLSSLRSASLPLYSTTSAEGVTTTITLTNPNNVGGVLAWKYATSSAGSNAGASAQYAATALKAGASTANATYVSVSEPRFVTGCSAGTDSSDTMTTATAMGKRYCYYITGLSIG